MQMPPYCIIDVVLTEKRKVVQVHQPVQSTTFTELSDHLHQQVIQIYKPRRRTITLI